MRRTALTLMEILAVCVLLGLVAVASAPTVARHRPPAIDAFTARLRAADLEVRLRARGQGARWEHRGYAVIGVIGRESTDIVSLDLPPGMSCTWTSSDRPVEELAIDRWGRSADLTVVVHDGRQERRLHCDGLIGGWRVESVP